MTTKICDYCIEAEVCDCDPTYEGIACDYFTSLSEEALSLMEYEEELNNRVEVYADFLREASEDLYTNVIWSDCYNIVEEEAYFD